MQKFKNKEDIGDIKSGTECFRQFVMGSWTLVAFSDTRSLLVPTYEFFNLFELVEPKVEKKDIKFKSIPGCAMFDNYASFINAFGFCRVKLEDTKPYEDFKVPVTEWTCTKTGWWQLQFDHKVESQYLIKDTKYTFAGDLLKMYCFGENEYPALSANQEVIYDPQEQLNKAKEENVLLKAENEKLTKVNVDCLSQIALMNNMMNKLMERHTFTIKAE
jgi:hypothetical protein